MRGTWITPFSFTALGEDFEEVSCSIDYEIGRVALREPEIATDDVDIYHITTLADAAPLASATRLGSPPTRILRAGFSLDRCLPLGTKRRLAREIAEYWSSLPPEDRRGL